MVDKANMIPTPLTSSEKGRPHPASQCVAADHDTPVTETSVG